VLEKSKPAVLVEPEKRQATKINPEPFLFKKTGHLFFNTSPLDMKKLMGDQDHIKENPIRFSEWLLFKQRRGYSAARTPALFPRVRPGPRIADLVAT
jgi:hypothetical protein